LSTWFLTKTPEIYDGDKKASSKSFLENWISAFRNLKWDPCLSPCANINSNWIKDLNVRPETSKQTQEVVGNTLKLIVIGNHFLTRMLMNQQIRERMNKWDCIKLKCFHTTKETVTRLKRLSTEWEKIFACYSPDKGLISRIYRKLKKLNLQWINNPMKKSSHELNREFSKEKVQMANK
jgi:hypothetical protein